MTSFFVPTGIEEIVTLYVSFLSKLDFDIEFSIQEIELSTDFGFVRTRSHGTIIPKGQTQTGAGGNREIFLVKKIEGEWKFYRYIFNDDV